MRHSTLLAAVMVAAGPLSGYQVTVAQGTADTINRVQNCELATRVLRGASSEKKASWAWSRLIYCDSATRGRVHAEALQRARTLRDHELVGPAIGYVAADWDMSLFDVVLSIADDRSASVEARVYAFMALTTMRKPFAAPSYQSFTAGAGDSRPRAGCYASRTVASQPDRKLSADQLTRISSVANRVRHDANEPAEVRRAASCSAI